MKNRYFTDTDTLYIERAGIPDFSYEQVTA
jgi:uncharacterized protein YuzE